MSYAPLRTLWADLAPFPWYLRIATYPLGVAMRLTWSLVILVDDVYSRDV